jgi:hypothetical protein
VRSEAGLWAGGKPLPDGGGHDVDELWRSFFRAALRYTPPSPHLLVSGENLSFGCGGGSALASPLWRRQLETLVWWSILGDGW